MKKTEDISALLDKLSHGNLSNEDAAFLKDLLKEKHPGGELEAFYAREWESLAEMGVMPGSSDVLAKLHERFDRETGHSVSWYNRSWVRYAAVFVLAFSTAWMVNRFLGGHSDSIEPYENVVTVAYGSKTDVRLPDGTVVKLNSGSELHYPSSFSKDRREVEIDGEGYFEVAKDKSRPFFVKTSDLTVKVLGTVFNVKAYDDENRIETTLLEGSVEVYDEPKNGTITNWTSAIAKLEPGNKATMIRDITKESEKTWSHKDESGQLMRFVVDKQVDCKFFTAWKDNVLKFDNEPFGQVAVKLERWYGVKIDIQDEVLRTEPVSGIFDRETIEQALYAISYSLPFHYELKKSHVVIRK